MKALPTKRALDEESRLMTLHISGECFDWHKGQGDDQTYYLTEHGRPDRVILWCTKEFWEDFLFKK